MLRSRWWSLAAGEIPRLNRRGGSAAIPAARTGPVSMNKADYPVFPDADAGADPSVPAEQGGKGFTGQGWETNTNFDLIGDPHAVKGGIFREVASDFPSTIRPYGPNTNIFNFVLGNLVYETLLVMDPTTLDYIPAWPHIGSFPPTSPHTAIESTPAHAGPTASPSLPKTWSPAGRSGWIRASTLPMCTSRCKNLTNQSQNRSTSSA